MGVLLCNNLYCWYFWYKFEENYFGNNLLINLNEIKFLNSCIIILFIFITLIVLLVRFGLLFLFVLILTNLDILFEIWMIS